MGTSGVPWVQDRDVIIAHLKKAHGRVTHAARSLDISNETLRKKINSDPELKALLGEIRNEADELFLDTAENTLLLAMEKHDDMTNALKASFYVLNSKGKTRNWTNTLESSGALYLVKQDPRECDAD